MGDLKPVRLELPPVDAGPLLGRGGTAEVFAGVDPHGEPVALKRLRPDKAQDPDLQARLYQEADALRELHDCGVPRLFGVFGEGATHTLVLEKLTGGALAGTVSLAEAKRTHVAAFEILRRAHERGWVHRDVKPEHIWVMRSGEVRLIDWGLASRPSDPDATTLKLHRRGTPRFVPTASVSSEGLDIYALGVSLLQVTTGLRAPAHNTLAVWDRLLQTTRLPVAWRTAVMSLLHPDVGERLSTHKEVANLLASLPVGPEQDASTAVEALEPIRSVRVEPPAKESVVPVSSSGTPEPTAPSGISRWVERVSTLGAGMGLGALLVGLVSVLLIVWIVWGTSPGPPDLRSTCLTVVETMVRDQHPSGGVSGTPHSSPTGWDTAQQLAGWKAASRRCGAVDEASIRRAHSYLDGRRTSAGWSGGTEPLTIASAWAVLAEVDGAMSALLGAQNADGSFGWSPGQAGHPYASVAALLALPDGPEALRAAAWVEANPVVRQTPGLDEQAFVALRARGRAPDADALRLRMDARCGDADCRAARDGRLPHGEAALVTMWLPWAALASAQMGDADRAERLASQLARLDTSSPAYRRSEQVWALAHLVSPPSP